MNFHEIHGKIVLFLYIFLQKLICGELIWWKLWLTNKNKFPITNFTSFFTIKNLTISISFSLQENPVISQRTNNLNEYYESLRNNVITLLESVRIPNSQPADKMGHENFDSYLSKLQSLCTPDGYCPDPENRPMYETVKSALQDFTVLPTPI